MNKTKLLMLFPAILLLATSSFAQDEKAKEDPDHYYRLDFVVKEIGDGRIANSRSYSTIVRITGPGHGGTDSIRTGSKVPEQQSGGGYTYMDVGVSIDCQSVHEAAGKLMLSVSADISSLAETTATSTLPPVIRNNRWSSTVVVPIGKPTTIFSSDDVGSKGKMQLEMTATPIA
jgi:hypothetical protein